MVLQDRDPDLLIEYDMCGSPPRGGRSKGGKGNYFVFNLETKECESMTYGHSVHGNKYLSYEDCRDACIVSKQHIFKKQQNQGLTLEASYFPRLFNSRPIRDAWKSRQGRATAVPAGAFGSTMQAMTDACCYVTT